MADVTSDDYMGERIAEQDDEIERLRERMKVLKDALRWVADDVCGLLCPSTWVTKDGYPGHSPKCVALRAALSGEQP